MRAEQDERRLAYVSRLSSHHRMSVEQSPPDVSYESAQRRHILSRDWAKVHSDADRRKPFATVMGRFA